jgi:hypothetical protein
LAEYKGRKPILFYNPIDINVERLKKNQTITLGWNEKKYCVLQYNGDWEFEVLKSVNMKSSVGRKFWTPGFSIDTSNNFDYPDIRLDDGGDGFFENQEKEMGKKISDNYFYL